MTDARFADAFTSPAIPGETLTLEIDGFTVTATIHADDDMGPPWKEHDGHGEVTGWLSRDKRPGELILNEDHGSRRFYDFASAVKIARRDGWGPRPYRIDFESGAYGLIRANFQWFRGRELISIVTDWTDGGRNDATRMAYAALQAQVGAGEYAAMAARSDFEHLQAWCDDEWQWIGVALQVSRAGVDLTGPYAAALWGIDSESADYITDTANNLIREALWEARAALARLAA